MAQNINPVFAKTPDLGFGGAVLGSSANTAQDGTGANIFPIYQADAVEGSWVDFVNFQSAGSPVATVARLFICTATGAFTAGTTNTAANTTLFRELTLPAVTLSQVAAQSAYIIPLRLRLPLGQRLLVAFGTSTGAASTGWEVAVLAGKFS